MHPVPSLLQVAWCWPLDSGTRRLRPEQGIGHGAASPRQTAASPLIVCLSWGIAVFEVGKDLALLRSLHEMNRLSRDRCVSFCLGLFFESFSSNCLLAGPILGFYH